MFVQSGAALNDVRNLEQTDEFVHGEIRVSDDGAQQWFFYTSAGMNRNHSSGPRRGMMQYQMASPLPIFNEPRTFESADYLARS
jgi:hypothetical protein